MRRTVHDAIRTLQLVDRGPRSLMCDRIEAALCDCDHCRALRAECAAAEGPDRLAVMRGTDMPGRIVDDVRPDQRD